MSFDKEIRQLELKCQLEAQYNSLTRIDLELMRMKKKQEDYEVTKTSLNKEIDITKQKMSELEGGEQK